MTIPDSKTATLPIAPRLLAMGLCALAIGCGNRITQLSKQLNDPDVHVRRQAARAAAELGEEAQEAMLALSQALEDDDAEVRRLAAYALGRIGTKAQWALTPLEKALGDPDQRVRLAVAYAISSIDNRSPTAPPVLLEAARNGDARAIVALGELGPAALPAEPVLIRALQDQRFSLIRLKAAQALARIGPGSQAARDALQRATHDRDTNVRQAARQALKTRVAVETRTSSQ